MHLSAPMHSSAAMRDADGCSLRRPPRGTRITCIGYGAGEAAMRAAGGSRAPHHRRHLAPLLGEQPRSDRAPARRSLRDESPVDRRGPAPRDRCDHCERRERRSDRVPRRVLVDPWWALRHTDVDACVLRDAVGPDLRWISLPEYAQTWPSVRASSEEERLEAPPRRSVVAFMEDGHLVVVVQRRAHADFVRRASLKRVRRAARRWALSRARPATTSRRSPCSRWDAGAEGRGLAAHAVLTWHAMYEPSGSYTLSAHARSRHPR